MNNDDTTALEIERFCKVFNEMWKNQFKCDEEAVITNRQQKSRRPANLPNKSDIALITNECLKKLSSITIKNASERFCEIRSLYVLLTFDNARRGGEVSQLKVNDVKEGFEGVWNTRTEKEFPCPNEDIMCMVPGKNSSTLVGIGIEQELSKKLKILVNKKVRKNAGVHLHNPYVFPSLKGSLQHVSGNHEVSQMCRDVNLKKTITATEMRHYVATMVPRRYTFSGREQEIYLEHFGHSSEINAHVYRCPPTQEALKKFVQ